MKLRSIELALPDTTGAAAFLTDIWGMALAEQADGVRYLRGSGEQPYLVALHEAAAPAVRSVTFSATPESVSAIADRANRASVPVRAVRSDDLGGGEGITVAAPDGELFRFLHDDAPAAPLPASDDMPVKLTHVVLNAVDAEASGAFAEEVLGFRVSDRTKGMVFVRCNTAHHSIAFARAGYSSLNHVAFEMTGVDAVMRGCGRMRDAGMQPAWGPGRHGPGANVFAYFVAPFGAVVEFSTAVEEVGDDYRTGAPEDWTWPANRIDQWGISAKDTAALAEAERTFRFAPLDAA